MQATKAHIIEQLQKQILSLQGFKTRIQNSILDMQLGPITYAFPNRIFPLSAVHEFFCTGIEENAVSTGFISGIMAGLMRNSGTSLWISTNRNLFPPALKRFGIAPEKIVFIDLKKEKEVLWAAEEALKTEGLAAVIAETQELSFTSSRRLQLAVENSGVTGFIIRNNPRNNNITACLTRWQIKPMPGEVVERLPGVGYPKWKVELIKVRNGKPGSWEVKWTEKGFYVFPSITSILSHEEQKKTG